MAVDLKKKTYFTKEYFHRNTGAKFTEVVTYISSGCKLLNYLPGFSVSKHSNLNKSGLSTKENMIMYNIIMQ